MCYNTNTVPAEGWDSIRWKMRWKHADKKCVYADIDSIYLGDGFCGPKCGNGSSWPVYLQRCAESDRRSGFASLYLFPGKMEPEGSEEGIRAGSPRYEKGSDHRRNRLRSFAASSLQQIGLVYTSAGKAGFITAFYIVIVPVLGIFLHQKAGWKIWAAVAAALAGLYLLCITDGFSVNIGDFYVLLCALLFSLHILVIDHFAPKVDGVKMSCIQFFVCGIVSLVPMFLWEEPRIEGLLLSWFPLLYAGVLSCGVAYTLQIVGQKNVNPTVASLLLSLESCFSVLAGWIILGERLSLREGAGCILMFAAIVLAQLPERKEKLQYE